MMNTEDFISIIIFQLKNEDDDFVSINGQRFTFSLSIKEV